LTNFLASEFENIVSKIFWMIGAFFALVICVKMKLILMLKLLRLLYRRLKSSTLSENQPAKLQLYLKLLDSQELTSICIQDFTEREIH